MRRAGPWARGLQNAWRLLGERGNELASSVSERTGTLSPLGARANSGTPPTGMGGSGFDTDAECGPRAAAARFGSCVDHSDPAPAVGPAARPSREWRRTKR